MAHEIAKQKWTWTLGNPLFSEHEFRENLVSEDSAKNGLRSVGWKVCLGYFSSLDISTWLLSCQNERQRYEQLRKTFILDPSELKEAIDSVNHPLSLDTQSPWTKYFQDSELRKLIQQDVDRTYTDIEYFRNPSTREKMIDALFVYCKMHEEISYRQGMHELLALILWAVETDAIEKNPESEEDLMAIVLDKQYVEHDSFTLFLSLMASAKQWYEFKEDQKFPRLPKTSFDIQLRDQNQTPSMPILKKSYKIHHDYLHVVDRELYQHLETLGIEPQIYLIRWLRLLFGREFPLPQVYLLWDVVFADDASLSLVDFICLVMLLYIRDELLQNDYAGCLHRLMRFPAISDIKVLCQQAKALRLSPSAETGRTICYQNAVLAGTEEAFLDKERRREQVLAATAANAAAAAAKVGMVLPAQDALRTTGNRAFGGGLKSPETPSSPESQKKSTNVGGKMRQMGKGLSKSLAVLEQMERITDKPAASTAISTSIQAIKHVRDVLLGFVEELDVALLGIDDEWESMSSAIAVAIPDPVADKLEEASANIMNISHKEVAPAVVEPAASNVSVPILAPAPAPTTTPTSVDGVKKEKKKQPIRLTADELLSQVEDPVEADATPEPSKPPVEKVQETKTSVKTTEKVIKKGGTFRRPSTAPRKVSVQDLMNEVGDGKQDSKHAWLFGSGGSAFIPKKTSILKPSDELFPGVTPRQKKPPPTADKDPLGAVPPVVASKPEAPSTKVEVKDVSMITTAAETVVKPREAAPEVEKVLAIPPPATVEKDLDPLGMKPEKPRPKRDSRPSSSRRTPQKRVSALTFQSEIDDFEVRIQEEIAKKQQESNATRSRPALDPTKLGEKVAAPPLASAPVTSSKNWDEQWGAAEMFVSASTVSSAQGGGGGGPDISTDDGWSTVSNAGTNAPPRSEPGILGEDAWVITSPAASASQLGDFSPPKSDYEGGWQALSGSQKPSILVAPKPQLVVENAWNNHEVAEEEVVVVAAPSAVLDIETSSWELPAEQEAARVEAVAGLREVETPESSSSWPAFSEKDVPKKGVSMIRSNSAWDEPSSSNPWD